MAGITIQKNYVSSSSAGVNLANNWMVLVLGITSRGPVTPTLVQSYSEFTTKFGQPVSGVLTHAYVRFLLSNNVPVLFKRVIDDTQLATATAVTEKNSQELYTISATTNYIGEIGNNIAINFSKNSTTNVLLLEVLYKTSADADYNVVESYNLGIATTVNDVGPLVKSFITNAYVGSLFNSEYIVFNNVNLDDTVDWSISLDTLIALTGGTGGSALTLQEAVTVLSNAKASIWNDKKLNYAATYYPQLRFITTGGIIADTSANQNKINTNLGAFAMNCQSSFRVLIDYPLDEKDITTTVRSFITNLTANNSNEENSINPAIYAYFGSWGTDSYNNILPGSAGFLSALGRSGYNVYSRRIAGTAFNPGFTKIYQEMYIDALNNWQAEDKIQLNPILSIDVQNNLAVMGSSTLALPLGALSSKNPEQALDIVLVGDYIAAILNNIALGFLESTISRLNLNTISSAMSAEIEKFVTSEAITRYQLNFSVETIGKLDIECILYFPVGLEEVALTVTSVYDIDVA